jgi:hypothetical protein
MLLAVLQRKLEESIKRLETLHTGAEGSDDQQQHKKLFLMAESQREMFNLELKLMGNSNGLKSCCPSIGSETACEIIQTHLGSSDERNLVSAVLSLERAVGQCDSAIIHDIELSAEAIEAVIPALSVKLQDRKSEMAESHDSSKLLTATVESNYRTMRDGYLELLQKVFVEASVQWRALLQLQEPTSRWHLEKLQEVIDHGQNDPEVAARREAIYHSAQQQLDHFCSQSFEKVRNSTAYREKEECLRQIEGIKRQVFEFKAQVVQEKETMLYTSEASMDAIYMDTLEGLNQHLYELQDLLNQLVLYERRLTQLLLVATRREARMDGLGRNTLVVGDADVFHYGEAEGSGCGTGAEEMVRLGQRTMYDLRAPFRMGTSLRALAETCDLSPEDTERLLEYVLFAQVDGSEETYNSHL